MTAAGEPITAPLTAAITTPFTALDELFQELQQAAIRPQAVQREDGTIRLLYADSRIDEGKLDPLLKRYAPEVCTSYAFPERRRLSHYGFTPEQVRKNGNGDIEERVDVITIQLREYE
ncbi:MAG: hypothetical protein AABX13_01110 [Nanoarchaeota archaeon]